MHDESVGFHDYVDIVYRKKWLIVMVFVSVFLTTLYYVQQQPQVFSSASTRFTSTLSPSGLISAIPLVSLGQHSRNTQYGLCTDSQPQQSSKRCAVCADLTAVGRSAFPSPTTRRPEPQQRESPACPLCPCRQGAQHR